MWVCTGDFCFFMFSDLDHFDFENQKHFGVKRL